MSRCLLAAVGFVIGLFDKALWWLVPRGSDHFRDHAERRMGWAWEDERDGDG